MKAIDMRGRRAISGRIPYRREEILRVAVELFHRHGVSSANVEAVASKAGIRPASLYHHFRDKQAIVDAVVDRAHARLVTRLNEREIAGAGAEGRLGALVDELIDYVVEDIPLAAVGRHDRVHASQSTRRRGEQVENLLIESVDSAIAEARPGLSVGKRRALAHALIGAIWSVTHFDARVEAAALREYLRRAGRAVVLGRRARKRSAE